MRKKQYGGLSEAASCRRCLTRHRNIRSRINCAGNGSTNHRDQQSGHRTHNTTNGNSHSNTNRDSIGSTNHCTAVTVAQFGGSGCTDRHQQRTHLGAGTVASRDNCGT